MAVNWTPELKKDTWITRKKNQFLKKGASEEVALREAKDLFEKSELWDNWTKEATKYTIVDRSSVEYSEIADENEQLARDLAKKTRISLAEAYRILNEEEIKKLGKESTEDENSLFSSEDFVIRKDRLNFILVHRGRTTYHNKISHMLEHILEHESRMAKDKISDIKEIIKVVKDVEKKIIDLGCELDKKLFEKK